MKKCKYCGEEVSSKVLPLHLKRCAARPQVEAVKEPEKTEDPKTDEPDNTPENTENDTKEPDSTPECTKDYAEMDEQELRVLAKSRGIAAYHNKGLDKIIVELSEMDAAQE